MVCNAVLEDGRQGLGGVLVLEDGRQELEDYSVRLRTD